MGVIQNSINQGLAMASVLGQMQGVPEMRKIKKGEKQLSEAYSKAMSEYDKIGEDWQKTQSEPIPMPESLRDTALEKQQRILNTIKGEQVNLAQKKRELTHDYSDYEREEKEKIMQKFTSNIMDYQKEYADFANSLASLQKQQANEQKMQVKKHKFDKDIIGGMYE